MGLAGTWGWMQSLCGAGKKEKWGVGYVRNGRHTWVGKSVARDLAAGKGMEYFWWRYARVCSGEQSSATQFSIGNSKDA